MPRSNAAVASSSTSSHGPTPFIPPRLVGWLSNWMMSIVAPSPSKRASTNAGACRPVKVNEIALCVESPAR